MKTTLNEIRKNDPCSESWIKLLEHLGKTKADDTEVRIADIAEWLCGDDAIWALRAVDGYDREKRLFAVWCARQVQHLMTDKRSINAVDVAERYANGNATDDELVDALEAAQLASLAAAHTSLAALAAWEASREAGWAALAALAAAHTSLAALAAWDAARAAWWAALTAMAVEGTQKTELLRMCACIESGKRYEITKTS